MADIPITTSQVGINEITNFDLHDPRTLKLFADRYLKPTSFLKDFFFPTSPADMFSTEAVLIDNMNHSRKVAPFVISGGKDVARDTFLTDEYKPPRIAPARVTTVDDLKKRGFGEALFNGDKPNIRAVRMTVKDMQDMSDMITRREEIMCSEVLRTNACVMKHIDPTDPDTTETHTLKFYSGGTNPQEYTPATSWGANADVDILGDLYAMRQAVRKTGNPANILLVSSDVANVIMNNNPIYKMLDNRRIEIGQIAPLALGDGAVEICKLNVKGAWISVVMYDETYEADNGDDTPYLPTGTAILTAQGCGRGLYGGVIQLEHGDDEFKYYEGRRVPKLIKDVNKDEKKLQLVARPIMAPVTKGAWLSAKAIF